MSKKEPVITAAEWIVAAIGGLLVGTAVVFLALSAFGKDRTPASFAFHVDSIYRIQGGFAVRVDAKNTGTETASHVVLEATLEDAAGQPVEESTLTFDYLPGSSTRGGVLFFTHDPARGRLALRAVGYEEP